MNCLIDLIDLAFEELIELENFNGTIRIIYNSFLRFITQDIQFFIRLLKTGVSHLSSVNMGFEGNSDVKYDDSS